ncbi:hypothetical protein F1559_002890 [Cyanidiococcus yangmingshanensis]|uniref:Uncharacterized protein n=1 Tax=Cyanidiococcus yangmingshanensis TaxID=2690220 RepID=A0A7J7IL59_9RHOD|nr:hypothetical protein F1559_002890 [Cyanidiococcus yangmingshanensis]
MPQAEHSLTNDNQTESPSFKANVCDPEAAQRGCGASGGLSAGALGHQAAAPIPLTVDPSLEKCERLELHENTCSCMCDALENMGSQLDSFVSMNTADVVAKVRSAAKRLAARLDETADEERLRQACLSLCDLFGDGIHHDLIQAILDTGVVPRVVRILEPLIEDDVCNVDPVHVQAPGLPECDMASTSNVRRQVGLASDDTESGSVSGEGNNGRDAAFSGQKNHKTILREGGRSTDRGRSNVVRRRFRRKEVSLGLQSAALQVIGNIACGDDRQTQVIIDCPNALAILRALLASPEPCIQKECCWIISNITESSHQVQDIIKAGVLVPLIGIFAGGHESCDEDAAWVLYNVTANGDPEQVRYLADIGGISALCSLLLSSAELEVAWKGCSTVAAVALRALTNVLIALPSEMPFRIASEYGVECLDLLAYGGGHTPVDHEHRQKAKELLEKFFKTNRVEQADGRRTSETMHSSSSKSATSSPPVRQERPPAINDNGALPETSESAVSLVMHETAGDFDEAKLSDSRHRHEIDHHIVGLSQTTDGACQHTRCEPRRATPAMFELPLPLCEVDSSAQHPYSSICAFCSGSDPRYNADAGDFMGSARREKNVALMARAIRMDHQPCLQRIIDSRMTWSDVALVLEKLIPEASGCYAGYQGLPSCTALFPHDTAMDASMLQSSIQLCPSKNLDSQFSRGGSAPGIADSRLLDSAGAEGSQMPLVYGRRSVLMLAAHLGRVECLRIILGRLRPTLSSDWMPFLCSSLLSGPAFKGHLEIVRMLLGYRRFSELPESKKVTMARKVENEMNVFERETSELNALHLAAAAGHASICAELLNEFPEAVNTTDRNGTTALSFAAQFGHADACRVLLKHGADILALDRNGRTALHFACSRSRSETVQLLLEYAETAFKSREGDAFRKWLDARTTGGLTPLHHAIQGGNVDCVELLIRAGACIQDPLPDSSARNPLLVFAAEADSPEIAQLLLKAGASVKTFATMRIRIGDICDLLALSAPEDALNAEIEDIFTPLHIAASKGNVELVQMLMIAGAEINVRSVTGWSPLDLAVMNGFEAIASLLLAAGAIVDPNVKFIPKGSLGSISTGKTLVQIAAMSHRKELVRMLIERLRTQRTTEEQVLSSVAVGDIASAATSTDIGSVHMLERHGNEVDTADAAITSEMSVNRRATYAGNP